MSDHETIDGAVPTETKPKTWWYYSRWIAGGVAAIVACVLSVLKIYDWVASPRGPDISIIAYCDAFEYPPELEVPDEYRAVLSRVTLSLSNVGDRPAEDVVVNVLGHGIAKVTRDDGSTEVKVFTKRLELGRLRHNESVSIGMWLDEESLSRDGVVITHNTGTTTVSLPRRTPTRSDAWPGLNVGIVFVLALIVLALSLVATIGQLWHLAKQWQEMSRLAAELERERTHLHEMYADEIARLTRDQQPQEAMIQTPEGE